MLKLLLKKQLLEIFSSYFYDAKKNKVRSKVSTVMYFLFFALLFFGILGGMFTFLAGKLCAPLAPANLGWFYFALMGLIAVLLGTFGSIFNTYAGLYLPKDNDLLLSLPIPVSALVASRLFSVYLMVLTLERCWYRNGTVSTPTRLDAGRKKDYILWKHS